MGKNSRAKFKERLEGTWEVGRVFERRRAPDGSYEYLTSWVGYAEKDWLPTNAFGDGSMEMLRELDAILDDPANNPKPDWLLEHEDAKARGVNVLKKTPGYKKTPKKEIKTEIDDTTSPRRSGLMSTPSRSMPRRNLRRSGPAECAAPAASPTRKQRAAPTTPALKPTAAAALAAFEDPAAVRAAATADDAVQVVAAANGVQPVVHVVDGPQTREIKKEIKEEVMDVEEMEENDDPVPVASPRPETRNEAPVVPQRTPSGVFDDSINRLNEMANDLITQSPPPASSVSCATANPPSTTHRLSISTNDPLNEPQSSRSARDDVPCSSTKKVPQVQPSPRVKAPAAPAPVEVESNDESEAESEAAVGSIFPLSRVYDRRVDEDGNYLYLTAWTGASVMSWEKLSSFNAGSMSLIHELEDILDRGAPKPRWFKIHQSYMASLAAKQAAAAAKSPGVRGKRGKRGKRGGWRGRGGHTPAAAAAAAETTPRLTSTRGRGRGRGRPRGSGRGGVTRRDVSGSSQENGMNSELSSLVDKEEVRTIAPEASAEPRGPSRMEEDDFSADILVPLHDHVFPPFDWKAHLERDAAKPAPLNAFWKRRIGKFENRFADHIGELCRIPDFDLPFDGNWATVGAVMGVHGPWVKICVLDTEKAYAEWFLCDDPVIHHFESLEDPSIPKVKQPNRGYSGGPNKFKRKVEAALTKEDGTDNRVPKDVFEFQTPWETCRPEKNMFKVGQKLETYDPISGDGFFYPATVVEVLASKEMVRIHYDCYPSSMDKTVSFRHWRLFPCGFAAAIGWKCHLPEWAERERKKMNRIATPKVANSNGEVERISMEELDRKLPRAADIRPHSIQRKRAPAIPGMKRREFGSPTDEDGTPEPSNGYEPLAKRPASIASSNGVAGPSGIDNRTASPADLSHSYVLSYLERKKAEAARKEAKMAAKKAALHLPGKTETKNFNRDLYSGPARPSSSFTPLSSSSSSTIVRPSVDESSFSGSSICNPASLSLMVMESVHPQPQFVLSAPLPGDANNSANLRLKAGAKRVSKIDEKMLDVKRSTHWKSHTGLEEVQERRVRTRRSSSTETLPMFSEASSTPADTVSPNSAASPAAAAPDGRAPPAAPSNDSNLAETRAADLLRTILKQQMETAKKMENVIGDITEIKKNINTPKNASLNGLQAGAEAESEPGPSRIVTAAELEKEKTKLLLEEVELLKEENRRLKEKLQAVQFTGTDGQSSSSQ